MPKLAACGLAAAWLAMVLAADAPEWITHGRHRIRAALVEYNWAERSLMLVQDGEGKEPLPVSAQDLDLRSKIRLLFAEPFQDSLMAHREELSLLPAYRQGLQQLRQTGILYAGVTIALFLALSWYMSGAVLGRVR